MGVVAAPAFGVRPAGKCSCLKSFMETMNKKSAKEVTGMQTAILYILVSVLFSVVGQLLLKVGMNKLGSVTLDLNQLFPILWRMLTNPAVFFGLALYFVGTIFWLAALSRVDLSYAYPFASLSYVVMLIASWMMFNETITLARIIGTVVICAGVFLIYRN
jgi:drug/metabolite transporter (DMT)-like permease